MKRMIVNVQDKSLVKQLADYCTVIYVSKFMNVVGVEIHEEKISVLHSDPNVVDFHESKTGQFQPA